MITINGVEATARYFQFSLPGTVQVAVRAVKEKVDEMSVVSIQVTGTPLAYRRELGPPGQTAMPIISASLKLGHPYSATFSLNTPVAVQRVVAQQNAQPPAGTPTPGPQASKPAPAAPVTPVKAAATTVARTVALAAPSSTLRTATPALESAFSKALSALPAAKVTEIPLKTVMRIDGSKATTAARFGPMTPGSLKVTTQATSYKWDFGDGATQTTQSPTVTHDYFPAIQAHKVAHSFNVSCTVVHDNLTVTRTLVLISAYGVSKQMGTIVPYFTGDEYATFQTVGFSGSMIVRNIEDQAITLNQMAVVPISDDPSFATPAPQFTTMKSPITIQPHSSIGLGVYVTKAQLGSLGPMVNAFTVYYLGNTTNAVPSVPVVNRVLPKIIGGSGPSAPVAARTTVNKVTIGTVAAVTRIPSSIRGIYQAPQANVRFSHTFRIRLTDSGWNQPTSRNPSLIWDHAAALSAISAVVTNPGGPVSRPGDQVIDPATNTVAIALSSKTMVNSVATQAQVRMSVQSGLASIAARAAGVMTMSVNGPPPAGPVQVGEVCEPDNISDTDAATATAASLACQLTTVTETVLMPGQFQNAMKGDVILSPGQDGADNMIGSLLRALSPPHYHSHSGLMTKNFSEITHCTASAQRLTAPSNLTGIGGAGGIQPDVLQYAWPGSITQTVDNAINGERWNDPIDPSGNLWYSVAGFNPEPLGIENSSNDFVLVYPMVVKPLPENEAAARPLLRMAADLARSKGARVDGSGNLTQRGGAYYCFYGYTNPAISAGFTDPAPASAGWAQGLSPAVCSSFVWMCMKATGINLVGPHAIETQSELSATALANGEEVGAATPDGLFYYSSSGRQTAGQVLNTILYDMVMQSEGFAQNIPLLGSTVAQNIADQVMNMFAFNNPNMYGSSAWQNPGDANAIAPDDILWGWNPPCFGYAEQLQYLEPHSEQYTVSRWVHVTTYGTVSGTVTYNGTAVPGAHVSLNDMLITTTDGGGHFNLNNVPTGTYDLKAWATVTAPGGSQMQVANGTTGPAGQGEQITTTPASPNLNRNVVLNPLPSNFRSLALQFQWNSDHGDANPWHDSGVHYEGPNTASIPLGPGIDGHGNVGTYSYTYDYNTQGLFRCEYDFTAALLGDLSVEVTLTGHLMDDGSNTEQTEYTITFNVPAGGQKTWWMQIGYSGVSYHNGPSYLTGTATNDQLTS